MICVKRLIEADDLVNPHLRKGNHILRKPNASVSVARYYYFQITVSYLATSEIPQANSMTSTVNPTDTATAYIKHVIDEGPVFVFLESSSNKPGSLIFPPPICIFG